MTESTTSPTIHPDQLACRGCNNFLEIEGEMECINLHSFDGAVPKLPALADLINSRDGRGNGISEAKRAAVVAECDKVIAEAKAKLAELTALD